MDSLRPLRARKSLDKWERLKGYIVDLYKEQTLEQVVITLKDEHDFVVTKRQLVYRLGIWGCNKYSSPTTDDREQNPQGSLERGVKDIADLDSSDKSNVTNRRLRRRLVVAAGGGGALNVPPPVAKRKSVANRVTGDAFGHLAAGQVYREPSKVHFATDQLHQISSDPSAVATSDYDELTRLMVQYINESLRSGSVFVDLADHISRGRRLFKWATDTDCAINSVRVSHNAVVPLSFKTQVAAVDELIVDEHPQLLGTLLIIWKNTTLIDCDGNTTFGNYFIDKVFTLCKTLLGRQHLITEVFGCLRVGFFEPASCLERLEVLPSELFAQKSRASKPSFERRETSDYQTSSFLDAASTRILGYSQDLDLMNNEADNSSVSYFRQYSHEKDNEFLRTFPPDFPWVPSLAKGDDESRYEEHTLSKLGHPPPLSMGRFDATGTEGSWLSLKLEEDPPSLSEYAGQTLVEVSEEHNAKEIQKVPDASITSPSRTPSGSTSIDTGHRMDEDECSVSYDDESNSSSSSTADEQQTRALEDEKRRIVQKILDAFLNDLDSHLQNITGNMPTVKLEDANEQPQAPSQAEGSGTCEQSPNPRKRRKSCGGEKGIGGQRGQDRAGDKDENDETDEEQDDGNRRPRKVPQRQDGTPGMLFACPFFQWKPLEYSRKPQCAGPGWPSVHRLKEHLFRRHERPLECSRCRKWFDNQSALDSHLRVKDDSINQLCKIINASDLLREFKFGPDAKRRLKIKARSKQTEEEKWKEVYRILFDVREEEIPSPYYDHDISALDREETWKEYARREIMILLRERIEAEVERRFANVELELIAGLRDIVHDLELIMRRNFEMRQEEARKIRRDETPAISLPALDVPSMNTAQTTGNDEGQLPFVPGNTVETNNFLTGNFSIDNPQQELLSDWPAGPQVSSLGAQGQGLVEVEQPMDPAFLGGDWDYDFTLPPYPRHEGNDEV